VSTLLHSLDTAPASVQSYNSLSARWSTNISRIMRMLISSRHRRRPVFRLDPGLGAVVA
jgi:hypothetical protein